MSGLWAPVGPPTQIEDAAPATLAEPPAILPLRIARYGLAMIFVALATMVALVVEHLIAAPNLSLIFVLPVVATAVAFGGRPAMAAAIAGVLTFDFFFTRPYYSLRIASPGDLWTTALLLLIAAIVRHVAARSRRRAREAERSAGRAQALQDLAQTVIERRPEWEILGAAAGALSRVFQAPAVVALERAGAVTAVASAGGARLTPADEQAARDALAAHTPTRAGAYPDDEAAFDFWPVARQADQGWVIGVAFRERPDAPAPFVDVVRGYVAAAVAQASEISRA